MLCMKMAAPLSMAINSAHSSARAHTVVCSRRQSGETFAVKVIQRSLVKQLGAAAEPTEGRRQLGWPEAVLREVAL